MNLGEKEMPFGKAFEAKRDGWAGMSFGDLDANLYATFSSELEEKLNSENGTARS